MSSGLSLPLLEHVRIASPCPVRWEEMSPVTGDERVRHCDRCSLNVYNLSNMTAVEAEALLATKVPGTRLCAGFFRRVDGTVLTRDCPVGLRAARQRLARLATRIAAAAALVMSGAVFARARSREAWPGGVVNARPFMTLAAWLRAQPAPPAASQQWFAGDICVPTPPAQPATAGGS